MHFITLLASHSLLFVVAEASSLLSGDSCNCSRTTLDCSNRNKTYLLPQEICVNVTEVNLDNNKLAVFPDGLQEFKEVSANRNHLIRFPAAALLNPYLKVLRLKFNKISEFSDELHSLLSLEELRLDYNELTSLDFLPQPCNLRILSMFENNISTLEGPLRSCRNLTHLYFSSGNVESLTEEIFSQMSKLEEFWFTGNKLTYIPEGTFLRSTNLKVLRLYYNTNLSLSEGSFQGLSALETLDLSLCGISTLPARIFTPIRRLEYLFLSFNQISILPPNVFSGLHWLTKVNLDNNNLTDVPLLLDCCDHLEKLSLRDNNIATLNQGTLKAALRGETVVDLTGNQILPFVLSRELREANATVHVGESCECGSIRINRAAANFCVDVQCGEENMPENWLDAVNSSATVNVNA